MLTATTNHLTLANQLHQERIDRAARFRLSHDEQVTATHSPWWRRRAVHSPTPSIGAATPVYLLRPAVAAEPLRPVDEATVVEERVLVSI